MTEGRLNADIDAYLQAAVMNLPPPPITSDPLVDGNTPIEELLWILGLAANADDPEDYAESLDEHADRDAKVAHAAEKFSVQDQDAAAQLTQQLPQLASGLAGTLAGGVAAIAGPLTQIPQQFGQAATQALQSGFGAFGLPPLGSSLGRRSEDDDFASAPEEFDSADTTDEETDGSGDVGADPGLIVPGGQLGAPEGQAGPRATAPIAAFGPPPVPSANAAVTPAPVVSAPPPGIAQHSPGGAMAGMPVAAPGGGGPAADKETRTETKRVSAPTVRNGAPVQGRITTPPALELSDDAKPVVKRRFSSPGWP